MRQDFSITSQDERCQQIVAVLKAAVTHPPPAAQILMLDLCNFYFAILESSPPCILVVP